MKDVDLTDDNFLSDKMKINLLMLGALILNGVSGEVHIADIITVDEGAPRRGVWSSWSSWCNQVASAMPLATTRYSASVLEREMTVCHLADQETELSPRTTGLFSICVDDEIRAAWSTQKKIIVWHPLEIAHDMFHDRQMGLPRVVHVQTDLLHSVGDAGPCECQVLESPCNASELRGVLNGRPRVPRQLRFEVDWSRARLAVCHDRTFEDVKRVGALMEEQTIQTTLDGDAKEVVKWPEVLHGESPLKSKNGTAQ
jgi:hypothetical protein